MVKGLGTGIFFSFLDGLLNTKLLTLLGHWYWGSKA